MATEFFDLDDEAQGGSQPTAAEQAPAQHLDEDWTAHLGAYSLGACNLGAYSLGAYSLGACYLGAYSLGAYSAQATTWMRIGPDPCLELFRNTIEVS